MDSHEVNGLVMETLEEKYESTTCDESGNVSVSRTGDNMLTSGLHSYCDDETTNILGSDGGLETSWHADAENLRHNHCDDDKSDFEDFCRFAFNSEQDDKAKDTPDAAFYFESDHMALKSNEDYHRLLRVFVTLLSQRTAAVQDLDKLLESQHRALQDPLQFVSQLRSGQLQLARPRKVAELPNIAWECYTDDVDSVLASLHGAGHSTRQKQKRELMSGIRDSVYPTSSNASTSASSTDISDVSRQVDGPEVRPATFNQPWSNEEQRHLEQLLQKYPPERFEARRFAKIAAELPGRTLQQVTSRVQKYFIKLAKAGLPVPGRMPNLAAYGGRWYSGRLHGHHARYNHLLYRPSTFLTSYAPPVYMNEDNDNDDDILWPDRHRSAPSETTVTMMSDDENDILSSLRDSDEYRELRALTALRQSRLSTTQCPATGHSTDELTSHPNAFSSSDSVRETRSHIDLDYTSESTGVSSYLDPNYMPAV